MAAVYEAKLQLRVRPGRWLTVGEPHDSVQQAQDARREMIESASKDNGPDAAQYVRAHTRVIENTITTSTEVIT